MPATAAPRDRGELLYLLDAIESEDLPLSVRGPRWVRTCCSRSARLLNDDLRPTFERWYPGLKPDSEPTRDAAA